MPEGGVSIASGSISFPTLLASRAGLKPSLIPITRCGKSRWNMQIPIESFEIGKRYTHEEVYRSLGVGNAGGIRPSIGSEGELRRLVVMTTAPDARILRENPYHDRIEGDVLVYTAAGLEGHQSVAGHNKRLIEQLETPFPIYGFSNVGSRRDMKLGKSRWEFLGLLQYLRHYKELQVDSHNNPREAFVFEMLIHREVATIPVQHGMTLSAELVSKTRADNGVEEGDRIIAREEPRESGTVSAEPIRRRLLALPPEGFEHLIKKVLELTGFKRVTVTRYSQDGGIDVNAYAMEQIWPVRGLHVQVQAKRWIHTVGRREVAELRGSLAPFARGAIVTTSFFSRAALAESSADGKNPIVLIDGPEFAGMVGGLKLNI